MSFDHVAAMASLPLFRGATPDQLQRFARSAEPVHLRKGEVLYREGTPSDGTAFLITKGRLVITLGAGATLRELGDSKAGEVVGETALYAPGNPRSANVSADGDVYGLRFSQDLLAMQVDNPVVVMLEQALMAALARRLRRTTLGLMKEWQDSDGGSALPPQQRSLRDRVMAWLGVDR